jgi:hypothetical protein
MFLQTFTANRPQVFVDITSLKVNLTWRVIFSEKVNWFIVLPQAITNTIFLKLDL